MGKSKDMNIEAEILKASGEKACGKKEDQDAYLNRLMKAVHGVEEEDWENLSAPAQAWWNSAADAENDNKQMPNFPDSGKKEKSSKIERRGSKKSTSKKDEEDSSPIDGLEEDMEVILYGKKDKVLGEGEVIELGKKNIILENDDGDEVSVSISKILSFKNIGDDSEEESEEDDAEEIEFSEVEKGMVVIIDSDDETIQGEVEKVNKRALWIDGEKYKADDIDSIKSVSDEEETEIGDDDPDDDDDDAEEIEFSDVEKGMSIKIVVDGEDIEGEVEKKTKLAVVIDGDKYKATDIDSIFSASEEEESEEEEVDEDRDKLVDMICKFPKMKIEKMLPKAEKAGIDDADYVTSVFDSLHIIIDKLKDNGKLA